MINRFHLKNPKFLVLTIKAIFGMILLFVAGCGEKGDSEVEKAESKTDQAPESHDWPLFRGDPEMQGVSLEDLAPPLQLAWSFTPEAKEGRRLPPIEATPVVAGGIAFVGTQEGKFFAIEIFEGAKKWEVKLEGPITAPAAVVDGKVYVGDTYGIVYALDAEDGSEVWRHETDGKIEGGVNFLRGEDGNVRIFIGSHDYFLYCFDAESGEVIWSHETGNYIISTPSLISSSDRDAVCFGGCDGLLHVVSVYEEGEPQQIEIGSYVANTSAVRDGICYVADNSGSIRAIDISSGETAWAAETKLEYTASPAVNKKHLFVAGPDKRLVAYDRVMGEEVWAFLSPRALQSSPVVTESAVWQAGMDGRIYAVDPADGTEIWNFELGTQVKASPAISGGTLVICGEDGVVYGFRK